MPVKDTFAPRPPTLISGAYQAVWRWHFYAGVLVLPMLSLMAATGALYLFKDGIDATVYRPLSHVEARAQTTSPDLWVAVTERTTGGIASSVVLPARPDQAVRLTVKLDDGSRRTAFVDPHDARLVGVTPYGGVMEIIKGLHSLSLVGEWATYLVEIVAGWAIILVATGLFLWWTRSRTAGIVTIKAKDVGRRPFWRDLHAVTGLYAGGIIAFLAITGMPWSAFWGHQYTNWVKDNGLGRPSVPAASHPFVHAAHKDTPAAVGWTMDGLVMPGQTDGARTLAAVVKSADAQNLVRPYTVSIPSDPALAYTAARVVKQVEDTRTLYIDGTTGAVNADIRYKQFGIGAKAFEWGIAVHQGTQYGRLNQFIMLGGCIAIWVLSISAVVMWWRRRPPNVSEARFGAPVAPQGVRARAAVIGIVVPLAILYPLTGLSLMVAIAFDLVVQRFRRVN